MFFQSDGKMVSFKSDFPVLGGFSSLFYKRFSNFIGFGHKVTKTKGVALAMKENHQTFCALVPSSLFFYFGNKVTKTKGVALAMKENHQTFCALVPIFLFWPQSHEDTSSSSSRHEGKSPNLFCFLLFVDRFNKFPFHHHNKKIGKPGCKRPHQCPQENIPRIVNT